MLTALSDILPIIKVRKWLLCVQERISTLRIEQGEIKEPPIESVEQNQSPGDGSGGGFGNDKRYYFPVQIAFMTLFGTILAGFYALAANYNQLGMNRAHKATILCAFFLVPAGIYVFSIVPKTGYDRLFPIGSAFCMALVGHILQGKYLKAAAGNGARRHPIWKQIIVIIVSLVILVVALTVLKLLSV